VKMGMPARTFCHVCSNPTLLSVTPMTQMEYITSDCRPAGAAQLSYTYCDFCALFTTVPTLAWRERCNEIYRSYVAHRQSGGKDESTYGPTGVPVGRSEMIIDEVSARITGAPKTWLDFGCGSGTLLVAAGRVFSNTALIGLDFDRHTEDEILAIPKVTRFVTSASDVAEASIEVVSMIHVLEHLSEPVEHLAEIRRAMTKEGLLVIQVPDVEANPYALTVIDHAIHFERAGLCRLVEAAGFRVEFVTNSLVVGELTCIARVCGIADSEAADGLSIYDVKYLSGSSQTPPGIRALEYLAEVKDWLASCATTNAELGIFGTSIAGTWAAATLDFANDFWVDENEDRIGRDWYHRPVLSPNDVPANSLVVLPLAPAKARAAYRRLCQTPGGFRGRMPTSAYP